MFFFRVQGLFGKKYLIAPEYLVDIVYQWIQMSGERIEKSNDKTARFLNMITDHEKRLYYAEKVENYDVAIDVSRTNFVLFDLKFVF